MSKAVKSLLRSAIIGVCGALVFFVVLVLSGQLGASETSTTVPIVFEVVDRETEEPLNCGELIAFSRNGVEEHRFKADEEGLVYARFLEGAYSLNIACPGADYPVHVVWGEFVVSSGKADYYPDSHDSSLVDVVNGRLRFKLLAVELPPLTPD